jgi:hypothetical protein
LTGVLANLEKVKFWLFRGFSFSTLDKCGMLALKIVSNLQQKKHTVDKVIMMSFAITSRYAICIAEEKII